jgi:hypothetical protein
LGAVYQNGLAAASSWPSGVSLLNQNSVGSGWEIGAYVFSANGSSGTRLLMGCCR